MFCSYETFLFPLSFCFEENETHGIWIQEGAAVSGMTTPALLVAFAAPKVQTRPLTTLEGSSLPERRF